MIYPTYFMNKLQINNDGNYNIVPPPSKNKIKIPSKDITPQVPPKEKDEKYGENKKIGDKIDIIVHSQNVFTITEPSMRRGLIKRLWN